MATVLTVIFLVRMMPAIAASGSTYGEGAYSSCRLQERCEATSNSSQSAPNSSQTNPVVYPSTKVIDPGGIEFAVNLKDGQTIPRQGYVVTVTALKAADGDTISGVDFLLDGRLLFTATPNAAGAVEWIWDPSTQLGSMLTITVSTTNGKTTSRQFQLNIQPVAQASRTPSPSGPMAIVPDKPFLRQIIETFNQDIKSIPAPLAYSFPYLLFIVLGLVIASITIQTRREVQETQTLKRSLELAFHIASERATFIDLSSHYLRTPLAIMNGAIEVASLNKTTSSPAWGQAQLHLRKLNEQVENLLQQTFSTNIPSTVDQTLVTPMRTWLRVGFVAPILLVGFLALSFNLLLINVRQLPISAINGLTQVAIFIFLATLLYVALRSRLLQHRDAQRTELERQSQTELDDARDRIIQPAHEDLSRQLHHVADDITNLSSSPNSTPGDARMLSMLLRGCTTFRKVLEQFGLAQTLTQAADRPEPVTVTLQWLLSDADSRLTAEISRKRLAIRLNASAKPTAVVGCPRPDLLQFVLTSVLDNAVAYAPENSVIDIGFNSSAANTYITITNQGPGISKNDIALLFQPFVRVEGSQNFSHEGMGFSLYLDRLIMKYIGGTIAIESSDNITKLTILVGEA